MQAREEQKFRKAAEEQALQAAEEQARKAAEQARKAAEEQARKVAEEQARKAIEEQGKAAEEQARKAAEEQARKAREEQARKAAEEQARDAAEEQARKAREEQTTKVAEEQARKAAEEKTRKDLQDWVAADKAIADAARDGGAPVGLGRLNLVWQGRAGKTALARSLAGEAWEATASTVGAEQRLLQVTPAALNVRLIIMCPPLPPSPGAARRGAMPLALFRQRRRRPNSRRASWPSPTALAAWRWGCGARTAGRWRSFWSRWTAP